MDRRAERDRVAGMKKNTTIDEYNALRNRLESMPGWTARRGAGGQWTLWKSNTDMQLTIAGKNPEQSLLYAIRAAESWDALNS